MTLRYVDGLEPQAVADELSIGLRHYYRERKAAIEAVASVLWDLSRADPVAAQGASSTEAEREPLDRLGLLRLEATRLAQSARYARVDDVIQGIIPLLQPMLEQHKSRVDATSLGALPVIPIDRELLRQMFMGVLGYLIERSTAATILVAGQVGESALLVDVTVDAAAIPKPIDREDIEERLSALQEIANLSGANVLPLRSGRSVVGLQVRLPTDVSRTVLVVDDNRDTLELFRRHLSAHGYHVVVAQQAQEAIALARRLRPHAITLDLMMPDMNGWDLMQALLNGATTRHIPVIVCSVLKQKELALSLGATLFLEKPVAEGALVAALANLGGRTPGDEAGEPPSD
jgi:CheY-like chemotaxis protein